MEVAGHLSKPVAALTATLASLEGLKKKRKRTASVHQVQRRLGPDEETSLVEKYRGGASQQSLATKYGVHRTTIAAILERSAVTRRAVATPHDTVDQIADLYAQGLSSEHVGAVLGLDARTVIRYLREAGVEVRPRRGWAYD